MDKWRRGKDLRIGTPERERAISQLGAHLTAGRLDIHEYDERCTKAAAARFTSEIVDLFDDLPSPRPDYGSEPAPAARSGPPAGKVLLGLCIAAMLVFLAFVAKQAAVLALLAIAAAIWLSGRRR